MDNRNNPPALQTFTPVTAENLPQHFTAVEQALHLAPDTLKNLFSKQNLDGLSNHLDFISDENINSAVKSIEKECNAQPGDKPEVIKYFANQRAQLRLIVDKLKQHFISQKQVIIAQHAEHIKTAQQKLIQESDCNLGNHALMLDTLKQNIARALQIAAYYSNMYWPDLQQKNRDAFNSLFSDVAWINPAGKLALFPGAMKDFAALNLSDLLVKVNSFLTESRKHPNRMVTGIINQHLSALCTKQGDSLISMDNGIFAISSKAFNLEQSAAQAAVKAAAVLSTLEKIQESKVFEYENDAVKLEQFQIIRDIISKSLTGMTHIYHVIDQHQNLASALNQDGNEIQELLSQIEDIAERGPEDSRAATAALLETLEFTPVLRKKIIDGMQEVFINFHLTFQQKHRPDFLMQHYSALASQLTSMQAQLADMLDEALTHLPPFTKELQRVKEVEQHRNELKQSLVRLYEIVEKMNLEYQEIDHLFDEARKEFFRFLTDIQQNEWRADLLQRLDATLLDIDDLIKKYSDHPVFKHTSLDDVIIELMREAREKTLATRETVEPEFVPPALREEPPKITFMQRHPVAAKFLYGAGYGLLTGFGAGIPIALFLTSVLILTLMTCGVGMVAIIAASAAIAGACFLASTIFGVRRGLQIYNKKTEDNNTVQKSEPEKSAPSSTAAAFKKMHVNKKSEIDGYDSDDEEEVVADYSNHVIFVGDPPECAPVRQRLT